MKDADRFKLLHAPYIAPPVHRGDKIEDVARGELVKVGGWTDAPIPWPRILKTGRAALIVTEELARAVRTESEIAVAHHWAVGLVTVWGWRKRLGVDRTTEGTSALHRKYYTSKLPEWVAAEGREKAASPESIHRMSETNRGKKMLPQTRDALLKSVSRRKIKSHREAIGKAGHLYWLKQMPPLPRELVQAVVNYRKLAPKASRGVRWHSCEEAILGLGPDSVIASVLGRSKASVTLHRSAKNIPAFRMNVMLKNVQASVAKTGGMDVSAEELMQIFDIEIPE